MAKGYALILPEYADAVKPFLPIGVSIGGVSDYGGAKRVELTGKEIVEDRGYQIVVTRDPRGAYIELVENDFTEDGLNG